jgi:cytochrome c
MRNRGGAGLALFISLFPMQPILAAQSDPQRLQSGLDDLASAPASRGPATRSFPKLQTSDPEILAGYRIAQDVCKTCHVIHPDQNRRPILRLPGPDFAEIANRPGLTRDSLSSLIASQNWDMRSLPVRMPKQALSKRSTVRVAAYILSLRTQP